MDKGTCMNKQFIEGIYWIMLEHTSFKTKQPDSTTYRLNEDKITVYFTGLS